MLPPSTNTAPSLSPQWFSHCLVMVSKVTLEQNRELIRRGADKDEGRVCPQSQAVCKPASGQGRQWGQERNRFCCSLGARRALVQAAPSLGTAAVPPLHHCWLPLLQLWSPCGFTQGKACLSLWIASCPCLAMPVPLAQRTHGLGSQGGTLCCDPGLTPKVALPPVPEPGWVLYQHLCSCQVESSHPEGRKTSAGHVLNITEEGKMQTLEED